MPYLLNEEGVIVEDLDGVSWTDVIKQQRARAANEARVASMYAKLDEGTEEYVPAEVVQEVKPSELVKIEIGKENVALTASLLERMDAMSQRESLTTEAIVAALHAIGTHNPIVNVEAPNVSVEPAITVEQPDITVHPPEVRVEAPNVTVHPEIVVDSTAGKRTVTFVRDFSGRVEGAEITEE